MVEACKTCRYWVQEPDWETFRANLPPGLEGCCHIRSAPTHEFPYRAADDWCGEHKPLKQDPST